MLRHRWSGHDRVHAAKGGTAHVLFIRVEKFVSNETSSTMVGEYARPLSLSSVTWAAMAA
jgi:hypothetical protein